MPQMELIMAIDSVDAYLREHDLEEGYVPISAALMQHGGMGSGQPAVMFVFEVDGKKVLAKTSLQLLETMVSGMRAASGVPRAP